MGAILKNQFRTFLRNPGSMFMFIFPLVMVVTLISVVNATPGTGQKELMAIYASLLTIGVMSVVNTSFGANFMELRTSSLIKRLGTTQITKPQLLMGYVLWTIFQSFLEIVWVTFLMLFFTSWTHLLIDISLFKGASIDWVGVIYGIILLIIVSFMTTFFFISIAPNSESYQLLSLLYFFVVLYFGGLIFSFANIEWMNIFSLLLPQTYSAHFITGAFNSGNYDVIINGMPQKISIWDFSNWSDEYIKVGASSLNLIMPIVYTILIIPVAMKKFEFDA